MLLIRSHFPLSLSHAPDTPMTHLIFIWGKENWGVFPLKANFRLKAFAKKFKNFNKDRSCFGFLELAFGEHSLLLSKLICTVAKERVVGKCFP